MRFSPSRLFASAAVLLTLLLAAFAPAAFARNLYAASAKSDDVAVLDIATNQLVGPALPLGAGAEPFTLAITPDGKSVYVVNFESGTVVSIDTATNQLFGAPIPVPKRSFDIGITPDGSRAYIADYDINAVTAIDLGSRQPLGPPIPVGKNPSGIAITPDGKRVYVSNGGAGSVSVIDTATNQVVGSPIPVGGKPYGMAVTPDGRFVYVARETAGLVSVIDTSSNQALEPPITVGQSPSEVAITPNGARAYVSNYEDGTVSVIDTATRQVVGSPIPVGPQIEYLTPSPDGSRVFAGQFEAGRVSAIDTATNQVVGTPVVVGKGTGGIAIVPDQSPAASFSNPRARPGVPVTLNASASSDSDGTVANFGWAFGDKKTAATSSAKVNHTYKKPGKYNATLTVTDNEGCSVTLIFTGKTASCHGTPAAALTRSVKVAYPGVKLKCPSGAKPGGCRFKIKAVSKNGKKLKALSPTAKGKAKAGKAVTISLKPKKKFAKKLAKAKKVLVQEIATIAGESQTKVLKLKIVQ